MLHIRWAVWAGVCVVLAQDDPYCSVRYERLCHGKGTHVACQYPVRGPGPSCENYTSIIFTNELKQFILHYVNRRRQKIAAGHERVRGGVHLPKPEIMMHVKWDRELAYLAQRLADQCEFVHDDCRATVRYPYAGQTVGEVRWRHSGRSEYGARRTIGRVLDAWWGERRRVHVQQLISPFVLTVRGAVWGHFSQLAVWTLQALGCGAVHHGSAQPRLLLVCDFSHTNMLGQRTISPGPLAPCPIHTARQGRPYPLLCAPTPVQSNQEAEEEDDDAGDKDAPVDREENSNESEKAETREGTITAVSKDSYSTKLWPNRPVRPIIHDEEVDIIMSGKNHNIMKQNRAEEVVNRDQDRDIDTFGQSREKNMKNNDISQRHGTMRDNYDPDIQKLKKVGIERLRQEAINQDKEFQPVKQIYVADDTNSQYLSSQPKTVEVYQHFRPANERPPTKARPVDDSRSLEVKQVDDRRYSQSLDNMPMAYQYDDADYGYIRPGHDQIANVDRPRSDLADVMETNRPVQEKYGFVERDNRQHRPVQALVRNSRPVIPIHNDIVDTVRRPVKQEEVEEGDDNNDDHPYRKDPVVEEAKPTVGVSIKYRDNHDSLIKQKLNNELNLRNRELEFQKGQLMRYRDYEKGSRREETRFTETEMKNQQIDQKAFHERDYYRSSEDNQKGDYKARIGNIRKDLDRNRPPQTEVWRDTTTENLQALLPLKKKMQAVSLVTTMVVYRPTSLYSEQIDPMLRQRWMQTRVRPRRPGANALFQAPTPSIFVLRQSKKASLVLDKDEEEQLFQDTGFKLSTKKTE